MAGGFSSPVYATFTFSAHRLAASGIRYVETQLEWQEKNDSGVWQTIARSTHKIYIILTKPQLPWSQPSFPWVAALKYSCTWASGAVTREQVAEKIITQVNQSLRLRYDIDHGASSYVWNFTSYALELEEWDLRFRLTTFLEHLKDRTYSDVVNCTDCATICATFANAAGCQLSEKWMYNTRTESGFNCNKIQAIGYTDWEVPFDVGFSYHEVCMMEPLQMGARISPVAENNYYVYDACLKLDASAHPESDEGRDAYLPTGMQFSEFANNVAPIGAIPVNRSYREHLAENSQEGIGSCLYYNDYNGINAHIYKAVI